ncbi:FecR family protein [Pinibacter soli]|uniref:FecR domain-containing protein n=1 Tax=Pinibacter soli TaxID=3044211 RepID=A0ABT6RA84_9BACT|nr:FecR family protein [Pinibacter soli]MDI3319450.1 FecR domain-containing protein [Pinibacter soli]
MENLQLKELFRKYLENRCTADEVETLVRHFDTGSEVYLRQLILYELDQPEHIGNDIHLQALTDKAFGHIRSEINKQNDGGVSIPNHKFRRLWPRIAVAASVLFIVGLASYFIAHRPSNVPPVVAKQVPPADIAPGGNKAILILSRGQQINLSNAQNGNVAKDANVVIAKTADGKVVYRPEKNEKAKEVAYNTLKTPRGGKYDLTLSDGTKVWLNAASSITYPLAFTGRNREVEITGEAYFEVVHNAAQPFRVRVAGQVIDDLGTHFNINAYSDEPVIKTTLLEGSVRVSNSTGNVTLKPGQQAVTQSNQSIAINQDADMEEAIAWHHDLFKFNDASIETVMRQFARWYDVEVRYEGNIPQRSFSGKIYRNTSALKVSDILNYKQIHFRIEDRTIIVMP